MLMATSFVIHLIAGNFAFSALTQNSLDVTRTGKTIHKIDLSTDKLCLK